MASARVNPLGVAAVAATVLGGYLIFRGLWERQPLVTFGERPAPAEVSSGRSLLVAGTGATLLAGGLLAAAGQRWRAVLVALPGPVALVLAEVGPANRAMGWAGLLLVPVALVVAVQSIVREEDRGLASGPSA